MAGADLTAEVTTASPTWCPPWASGGSPSRRSTSGIKAMTPRLMARAGDRGRTCFRPPATVDDIDGVGADGVFFSNGPGDPATADGRGRAHAARCCEPAVPIFGICFGNQILGRALGLRHVQAEVRPPRHQPAGAGPCHRHASRSARTTTASRSTPRSTASTDTPFGRVEVSHVCLNDDVVEGLRLLDAPAFSVQYHPEAAAGPHDSAYLFDRFVATDAKGER